MPRHRRPRPGELVFSINGEPARNHNRTEAIAMLKTVILRYLEAVNGDESGAQWAADLAILAAEVRARHSTH